MYRWLIPVAVLVASVACGDADKDGLSRKEEKAIGTDPKVADTDKDGVSDSDEFHLGSDPLKADSDGDGLSDGDEIVNHANPLLVDTDGDGYRDGDEVANGSDPADEHDKIYAGGWPFNPNKADITDPGWDGQVDVDDVVPHFVWEDQFGDMVDIYDFAGQGKPIILDLSELSCYWCEETAKMLDGNASAFDGYNNYTSLKERVDNGDILWVTVIDGIYPNAGNPDDVVERWYRKFPNHVIPVLHDQDEELYPWLDGVGWPTMILVRDDMTVGVASSASYPDAWDAVLDCYDDTSDDRCYAQ